jgi:hypothetical protein
VKIISHVITAGSIFYYLEAEFIHSPNQKPKQKMKQKQERKKLTQVQVCSAHIYPSPPTHTHTPGVHEAEKKNDYHQI